jgi:hypothetical protein
LPECVGGPIGQRGRVVADVLVEITDLGNEIRFAFGVDRLDREAALPSDDDE